MGKSSRSCDITLTEKDVKSYLKIKSIDAENLELPCFNTRTTVRMRDNKQVYNVSFHGESETKYLGGDGWREFVEDHKLKKGLRIKLQVLDLKTLKFEVSTYISPSKRYGKGYAPAVGDKKSHGTGKELMIVPVDGTSSAGAHFGSGDWGGYSAAYNQEYINIKVQEAVQEAMGEIWQQQVEMERRNNEKLFEMEMRHNVEQRKMQEQIAALTALLHKHGVPQLPPPSG